MNTPQTPATIRGGLRLWLGLCGAIIGAGILPSQGQETGSSENLIIKKRLNDDWFLASRNFFGTRDGFDDLFFGYLDLNIGYDLNDDWSVEAGYRHAWLELGDFWRDEYRPSALLNYSSDIGEWSFSNRHRLEYRMFEGDTTNDRFRYRNETRLISPWELTPLKLTPFLEEEFFYDFDDSGFNINWLTTGVRYEIADGVIAKLGYRWHAQKFGDEWTHRHVLVTGILIFF